MISTYRYKQLVWTDLESPTEEELSYTKEDLPEMRTKVIPFFDKTIKIMRSGSSIMTLHDGHFDFLDQARYRLESAHEALNNPFSEKVEFVYLLILEEIAKAYQHKTKEVEAHMKKEFAKVKKSSANTTLMIIILCAAIIGFIILL